MIYNNLKIPEKNGEFLCIPHLHSFLQVIKSNKEKIKDYNFFIGNEDFHNFRDNVRKKVIQLSEKFTANLGIKSYLYNNSNTIVQTGHQPIFYHPGIIIKNLLLSKIGKMEGINAINLIVDTDNFKEIAVNIPSCRDGIKIEKEMLLSNQHPIPFEFSLSPSQKAFALFIESIKNHLSNPKFENLYDNFIGYANRLKNIRIDFKTLSEFMTAVRRIYEDEIESKYLEIPLSHICDTDEFLLFFLSIAVESEKFTSIYNYHLERYRKEHKLRYTANPFPNLAVDGEKAELPFWHFYENKRGRVFAKSEDDTVIISFKGGDSIEFNKKELNVGIDLIKKNNLKIRPKAIIITLFNRLFVSDAFIHGVGGAKYDMITDNILRDFYKIEPPQFITASLTLYPKVDFPQDELQDKITYLEKKLRDMKYNPERYIIPEGDLLKEKENLRAILKTDNTDKKEISIKLKEINERIYQKIKSIAEDIEEEIKILKGHQSELNMIQKRDYPYFLFSPEEIMKTLPFHRPS